MNLSLLMVVLLFVIHPVLVKGQQKENTFLRKQQTMAERWELEPVHHKGVFVVTQPSAWQ